MEREIRVNGKPLDPDAFDGDDTAYQEKRTKALQAHRRRRGLSGEGFGVQSNFGQHCRTPRHAKHRQAYD